MANPNPLSPVTLNISRLLSPTPSDRIRKVIKVSSGDTNIPVTTPDEGIKDGLKLITSAEVSTIFTGTPTSEDNETYRWLLAYFANNPRGSVYVLEQGADSTPTDLDLWITYKSNPAYWYCVPSDFFADATLKTIADKYSSDTGSTYFVVNAKGMTDPTTDANHERIKGTKSIIEMFDVTNTSQDINGAVAGVFASSKYDLSESNQMTPFQWKRLLAITPDELSSSLLQSLNDEAINWAGVFNGQNVLLNGRTLDNVEIDYWFAFDHFYNQLIAFYDTAFYNGSNNSVARIGYDQDGIDKLLAVVEGRAKNGVSIKTITNYAESIDVDNNLVNTGKFLAIPFYTYIANNPDKYGQSIYDGISGVVQIGRFIRAVTINLTLS